MWRLWGSVASAGGAGAAAVDVERGLAERPDAAPLVRIAAAIYGMAGDHEEAKSALTRLQEVYADLRVSNLHEVLGPYRAEYRARYEEGLRKAGLPE